jgi:hypothetical protein
MTSSDPQRWARGLPSLLWKRPGLPRDWVPVLDRHPEGVRGLPGHVWLDMPGKVRSVGEHELEFKTGPSAGGADEGKERPQPRLGRG